MKSITYFSLFLVIFALFGCGDQANDASRPSLEPDHATTVSTPNIVADLEVYPKEIYYGDLFFSRPKICNQRTQPIQAKLKGAGYHDLRSLLFHETQQVYVWASIPMLELRDSNNHPSSIGRYFPLLGKTLELSPEEEDVLSWRLHWLPMAEYPSPEFTEDIEEHIQRGDRQFRLEYWNPLIVRELNEIQEENSEDIRQENWPESMILAGQLIVKPRPKEELELLRRWYLELPDPLSDNWTNSFVFANLDHIRNSPTREFLETLTIGNKYFHSLSPKDRFTVFQGHLDDREIFRQRSREILMRIMRTNAYADQLLERSKQPDSTISQNMVEFIQLRGLLVDVRYAENEEAEETAFEKLVDFVDQSQGKEHWIDFMREIGFDSIEGSGFYEKITYYREQFVKRFQIK